MATCVARIDGVPHRPCEAVNSRQAKAMSLVSFASPWSKNGWSGYATNMRNGAELGTPRTHSKRVSAYAQRIATKSKTYMLVNTTDQRRHQVSCARAIVLGDGEEVFAELYKNLPCFSGESISQASCLRAGLCTCLIKAELGGLPIRARGPVHLSLHISV